MTLGEILRDLLVNRNHSQKELSETLNITQSALSNYLKNSRDPDYDLLKLLADYFDVSTDYLLNHRTKQVASRSHEEDVLLDTYRRLTVDQQEIFLKLGKLFVTQNLLREKKKTPDSLVANQQPSFKQQK